MDQILTQKEIDELLRSAKKQESQNPPIENPEATKPASEQQVLKVAEETNEKIDENVGEFKEKIKYPSLRLAAETTGKSTKELVDKLVGSVFGKKSELAPNMVDEGQLNQDLKQINSWDKLINYLDDIGSVKSLGGQVYSLNSIWDNFEKIKKGNFFVEDLNVPISLKIKITELLKKPIERVEKPKIENRQNLVHKIEGYPQLNRAANLVTTLRLQYEKQYPEFKSQILSLAIETHAAIRALVDKGDVDTELAELMAGYQQRLKALSGESADREIPVESVGFAEEMVREEKFASLDSKTFKDTINMDTAVHVVDITKFDPKNVDQDIAKEGELVEVPVVFIKGMHGHQKYLLPKALAAKVVDFMIMGDGQVEFEADEHLDGSIEMIKCIVAKHCDELYKEVRKKVSANVDEAVLVNQADLEKYDDWTKVKFEVEIEGQGSFFMWKLISPDLTDQGVDLNVAKEDGIAEKIVDERLELSAKEKLQNLEFQFAELSGEILQILMNMDTTVFYVGIEDFDPENIAEFGDDELVRVDSTFLEGLSGVESFLLPKALTAKIVDFMIMGDGQVDFMAEEHLDSVKEALDQLIAAAKVQLSNQLDLVFTNEVSLASLINKEEIKETYQGWKKVKFEVEIEGQGSFVMWKLLSPDLVSGLTGVSDVPETTAPVELVSTEGKEVWCPLGLRLTDEDIDHLLSFRDKEDEILLIRGSLNLWAEKLKADDYGDNAEAAAVCIDESVENIFDTCEHQIFVSALHENIKTANEELIRQLDRLRVSDSSETSESTESNLQAIEQATNELDQLSAELKADDYGENAETAAELIQQKIEEIKNLDQNLTIAELHQKITKINEELVERLASLEVQNTTKTAESAQTEQELDDLFADYIKYISSDYEDGKKHPEIQAKFLAEINGLDKSLSREELEDKLDDIIARFSQEIEKAEKGQNTEPAENENVETVEVAEGMSLDQLRLAFIQSLHQRGNVVFNRQKANSEDLAKKYQEACDKNIQDKLELKKASLLQEVESGSINLDNLKENLAEHFVALLLEEESAIDAVCSTLDKKLISKFKEFWKTHSKARLAIGATLFTASLFASSGATGILAGILTARGIMSSTGTFMASEAMVDKRTAWGQKGLIDEMKNLGFRSKKKEPGKITEEDVNWWREELSKKEEYPTEVLAQELARLRILSLDKGTDIDSSARFGQEQEAFVQLIKEVYYQRLGADFSAKIKDLTVDQLKDEQTKVFSDTLKTEKASTEQLISAQDKSRTNAMKRYGVAAALGLTVGAIAGSRVLEQFQDHGATDTVKEAAKQVTDASPDPGAPETSYLRPNLESGTSVGDFTNNEVVVAKGDTLWGVVEERIASKIPNWQDLNTGQRTYLVDYFKDKVAADPQSFGITGDLDKLSVGNKINFGNLFSAEQINQAIHGSDLLTADQIANIEANNEALNQAVRAGIKISSENVDQVATEIKLHGTDWISKNGEIHQWSFDHQPVEKIEINGQTIYRLVEKPEVTVDDLAKMLDHQGHNFVPEVPAKPEVPVATLDGFLQDQVPYSSVLLKTVESDPQQLDSLVDKVFESSPEVQRQFLQDHYPRAFTADNSKAAVFLKVIEETPGKKITELDNVSILEKHIRAFDRMATSDDLPKKAWEARFVKDENGREFYAFARRLKGGLFSKGEFELDDLSGRKMSLPTKLMKSWLHDSVFSEKPTEIPQVETPSLTPEEIIKPEPITETPPVETPVVEEMLSQDLSPVVDTNQMFTELSKMSDGSKYYDASDNVFTKISGKIFRYDPLGDPTIEVRNVQDLENLYKK